MCGILGYVSSKVKADNNLDIKNNLKILSHRGPDEKKIVDFNYGSIGHTRLSIIGLKTKKASQPIIRDGKILSFNGEIYNYLDLVKELKLKKINVSGKSDTEALFLLLKNFGIKKTLKKINGMYAFCWCDIKKNFCYLVRDKIGEKSLYYYFNKKDLFFSSEIKALISLNSINYEINKKKLVDYFYTAKINGSETFFKNIYEVEPGQIIKFDIKKKKLKKKFFWKLENFLKKKKEIITEQDFKNILKNSVKSRFISDAPIGILLSGGLDSASILRILLEEYKNKKFSTFTATNKYLKNNEEKDAKKIRDYLSKNLKQKINAFQSAPLDFDEYISELKKISYFYDEPIQFFMSPLLSKICNKAKKLNFKVLYSGEGADEIFFGYDRFVRTLNNIKKLKKKNEVISEIFYGSTNKDRKIIKSLLGKLYSNEKKLVTWKWLDKNYKKLDKAELQTIFSQKFRLQTLLQRNDRVGMAHSIEIRTPFLNVDLIKKINNCPLNIKYDKKNKITKLLLKKVMKKRLPESIINKKKEGFPSDFLDMLFTNKFKNILLKYINNSNSFSKKYLNFKIITKLINLHFSKKKDFHNILWKILSLEIWYVEINNLVKRKEN